MPLDKREYDRRRRANAEYKAAENKQNLARNLKYRTDLMTILGDKCVKCGFADNRVLQIDHIKSGGQKERRLYGGLAASYIFHLKDAQKAKDSLQILCANCNWVKLAQLRESSAIDRRMTTYEYDPKQKRRADPEYRAAERIRNLVRILKYRTDLVTLLGARCLSCDFSDIRALQLDHIHGGGSKELDKNGNISMYYYYLKHPEEAKEKLQVLCANCNWIKRVKSDELPKTGRPRTVRLFDPMKLV